MIYDSVLPIARPALRILVTGANGSIGRHLIAALAVRQTEGQFKKVVAVDLRSVSSDCQCADIEYCTLDVRSNDLSNLMRLHQIDTVIHLASNSVSKNELHRDLDFDCFVDVDGCENVLKACLENQVRHLIVSSSAAVYGYHADNPAWLVEEDPLRENKLFPHAYSKYLVEKMLRDYQKRFSQLHQTIFRIGIILGEEIDNPVTALFEKKSMFAIKDCVSPFAFIWDQDVTGAFLHALSGLSVPGCYNLVGDGALTMHSIAKRLGKPLHIWPAWMLQSVLSVGKSLGLSRCHPEELDFLRYRPMMLNTALKTQFGYIPKKTTAEAFDAFVLARYKQGRSLKLHSQEPAYQSS